MHSNIPNWTVAFRIPDLDSGCVYYCWGAIASLSSHCTELANVSTHHESKYIYSYVSKYLCMFNVFYEWHKYIYHNCTNKLNFNTTDLNLNCLLSVFMNFFLQQQETRFLLVTIYLLV